MVTDLVSLCMTYSDRIRWSVLSLKVSVDNVMHNCDSSFRH
jgi:hypothetical protein